MARTLASFRRKFLLALTVVVSLGISPARDAIAQDPNRWESEISAFEQSDRVSPPHPGGIVFVGSSSIRLWDLKKFFPGINAVNRGFGGSYLGDTVRYFERIVVPYQPQIVVVYAGDNDLATGISPDQVVEQFDALVGKMKEQLPLSRLVYIAIKPSVARWNLIEKIRETNRRIQEKCESSDNLVFVNVDEPALNDDGTPNADLLQNDGLHLNADGYEIWTDLVKPSLQLDPRLTQVRTIYDHYHPWSAPNSLKEWEVVSEKIRTQLQVSLGLYPLPEKTELAPVIHGKIDQGDYTVEKVYFATAPGQYLTGSLYRPKHINGTIPGVLAAHGHVHDGRFTKDSPESITESLASGGEGFRSGASSYLQARAVQLARLGTIVFLYDMIGYADQGPLSHRAGFSDTDASLYLHNKMGLQTWNSIRALDFLLTLPEVDAERIGVTGESGGGTQSFILAALDDRAKVVFPAVMVSTAMQGGCICENADYLRVGLNNVALSALIAPRPLAMSCADDWTLNFEAQGLPELKKVYGFYGKEDLVAAKTFPQFGHNYNQPAREMMYNWFNKHLNLGFEGDLKQSDFWPLSREEQSVFTAGQTLPADALNEAGVRDQMRQRDQDRYQQISQASREEFVKTVRPAIEVLLLRFQEKFEPLNFVQKGFPDNVVLTKLNLISKSSRLPISLIEPLKRTNKIVVWIDGQGRDHLLDDKGDISEPVKKLLDAGYSVASADLLLTGATAQETNPLKFKLESLTPSHQSSRPNEDFTGFVYGYNKTLLANRAQDLDLLIQALKAHRYEEITLVGTGNAGLWTLLASSRWEPGTLKQVIADLQGFRFEKLDSNLDENLVPGALKYGGIGGILALGEVGALNIYGVGDAADAEFKRLESLKSAATQLVTSPEALSRDSVINVILN